MKAATHVALKERKRLVLSNFKGVDYSSSPFGVSPHRASNMRNLINEGGVNHKRRGWRQVKRFIHRYVSGSDEQQNDVIAEELCGVNGVFEYRHGDHSVVLVHAGKRIYKISPGQGGINDVLEDYTDITGSFVLTDERSQAFYSKGRLYITGCGDYLAYGTWDGGESYELRHVYGGEDTYIPTTSISINHDGDTSDTARAVLEGINVLTPCRKNSLLGASLTSEGDEPAITSRTWTLDGRIDEGTRVEVRVLIYSDGEETETVLENKMGEETEAYGTELSDESGRRGAVDFEGGKITLYFDTTPARNADNITVTFRSTTEGHRDRIKNCRFGVLFGADGNTDRLFLSGNPALKNNDFYSEPEDFSYFRDDSVNTVGSDAAAIKGYIRLADSTLVIFKEEYMNEPSLFYRTGTTKVDYSNAGEITDVYGLFPTVSGHLGETLVSRFATANFGADCLMLSQNGVYGVVLGDNARTTERYTRERSRTINEHLCRKNLSEAVATVHKNKYYLAVDGTCYVADARFTFRSSDSLDGAFNYEWWVWDNIPARVFSVIDNELYFGTSDGMLCRFDNEYTDRTYLVCESGELSVTPGERSVTVSDELLKRFTDEDRITFKTDVFVTYAENLVRVEESFKRLVITEDELDSEGNVTRPGLINKIFNGVRLYVENSENTGLEDGAEYTVVNVDRGNLTFMLAESSELLEGEGLDNLPEGRCARILADGFNLTVNVKDRELQVVTVRDAVTDTVCGIELREGEDSDVLTFAGAEGDSYGGLSGVVAFHRPVIAEWYTPVLDMGTNAESKTLLGITVCTEPETNGKIAFGYETRTVNKAFDAKGLNVFSFENLSFKSFSFDTGFASSYSVRVNERNFNFIIFRFISDAASDCAVNDITLLYKFNRKNIGVR